MILSNPLPMTSLGEIADSVLDEVDNEISRKAAIRLINQELGSICTKREWNFFYQTTTGTLLPMDITTGKSTLVLPSHIKKVFRIYVVSSEPQIGMEVYSSNPQYNETEYEQGTHYDLFYNETTLLWSAVFKNFGNTANVTCGIDYYLEPLRLYADDDRTKVPERFANVIVLAVLRRAKLKLMDVNEAVLHDRQFKEELQSMIDDDAREHDLPKQMKPNRSQSRDEYNQYFKDQRNGEDGLNGMGTALTTRYS